MLSIKNTSALVIKKGALDDTTILNANIIILKWVVFIGLCLSISVFGVVTNIINIICFVKQGFKDPINISLLGMAVSDQLSQILVIWSTLSFSPAFTDLDIPFEPAEVQYLITGMPYATFTTITAWITALITLERCLCITAPLKVKTLITPPRVTAIVLCVFIVPMTGQAPVYVANRLGKKFYPHKNKSLIGILQRENGQQIEGISHIINNMFLPFCAFIIIIVFTVTLVVQLQLKSKWREGSAPSSNAETVSNRNRKVAKMVIMISALFISCFTPICFEFIVMFVVSGFTLNGRYKDYLYIMSGFGNFLQAVNASSNIFIYYHMSSKYKNTFQLLFFKKRA